METPKSLIESLIEKAEACGKTTYELSKLKALESSTRIATSLISRLSVISMFLLFALVLNIGIALLAGELCGKDYYGFFIVAAFYLIAGIVLHFFGYNWIKRSFSNFIIKQALQ
jgi:hypothetical protein